MCCGRILHRVPHQRHPTHASVLTRRASVWGKVAQQGLGSRRHDTQHFLRLLFFLSDVHKGQDLPKRVKAGFQPLLTPSARHTCAVNSPNFPPEQPIRTVTGDL